MNPVKRPRKRPKKTAVSQAGVERLWTPTKGWRYRAKFKHKGRIVTGPIRDTREEAETDRNGMRQRAEVAEELRGRWTLRDGMDEVLRLLEAKGKRPATVADRKKKFEALKKHFDADMALHKLTTAEVERYIEKRLDALTPRSIKAHVDALGTVTKLALRKGTILSDPVVRARHLLPDPNEPNRSCFFPDEAPKILRKIRNSDAPLASRDADIMEFMLHTALRLREAADLHVRDVDLAHGIISIDGKRGPRQQKMTDRVRWLAARISKDREDPNERLLPLSYLGLQQMIRRWSERLDEPRLQAHALRRTCGLALALNGATAWEIRDHLGHRTLAQANEYVARAKHVSDAAKKLDFA